MSNDKIRILFAEDEKKIADTLKQGLEEKGYKVDLAYDGNLGWRMFHNSSYDLVILDINLPGINGYDLCKMIREENKAVPVVMLTAMGSVEDKVEGFDAGADDYIVKPFDFKELQARIKALLKRKHHFDTQSTILRLADLEMNLDTKEVTRSGETIRLTAKEFQLLEYFLRNQNKVLSRAEIALQVWELDFDSKTNVIDVYVNYLRNKIDKNYKKKLIHTVIGMGYVMKEQEN